MGPKSDVAITAKWFANDATAIEEREEGVAWRRSSSA